MNDAILIVVIVAGSLALVFVVVFAILRILVGKLRARVEAQLPAGAIVLADYFANGFGVQSRGVAQLRGNGALVLTGDTLHFFMLVPQTHLQIPLSAVTAVSFVNSHLGKTVGRKLLAVDFSNEEGAGDRAAWLVRDPDAWQQRLSASREREG